MPFQPEFTFTQSAQRVRFGPGIRHQIGLEVERLGSRRAVVLSTHGKLEMAQQLGEDIGSAYAGTIALAEMHTPGGRYGAGHG